MQVTKMAAALKAIADSSSAVTNAADGVLSIVKAGKLRTLETFDASVRAAYVKNGWQATQGRPRDDDAKLAGVPGTVKTYVSLVRAAYRAELPVLRYKSFGALRGALGKQRAKGRPPATSAKRSTDPALAGIRVLEPGSYIGAPFHDLAVGYEALAAADKEAFMVAAMKLLRSIQRKVPASVTSISERRVIGSIAGTVPATAANGRKAA